MRRGGIDDLSPQFFPSCDLKIFMAISRPLSDGLQFHFHYENFGLSLAR